MRRVVSAILGINTIVISGRKHNLARNDKNLQFIHVQLTEEINYNDYNMVVKYRMPNGNVLADVLEMETNEFDIQIPNEVVQLSGELAIEFTLSGKKNDDSLTSLGRIKLTIQDTLESNIDQEEIRVLPTVANVLSRITERTEDGITEIEKVSEEKINDINSFLQKQKEQLADEVSDYSQNLTKQKDNHLQDLDSKLSQSKDALDNLTESKKEQIETQATEKITSLEDKTKECIEDIYSRKAEFKGDKGDKGDKGEQGIQGIQGKQGEPGVVNYSKILSKDSIQNDKNGFINAIKNKFSGSLYTGNTKYNGIPFENNYGNILISSYINTAQVFLAKSAFENDLYYSSFVTSVVDNPKLLEKKWCRIWTSDNLNLQNLQPLTIESSVGNHVVLKRSGELKGSLTSNQDGIALYNEKSGKMLELKDNGDVIIPANNLETENKDIVLGINELKQEIEELKVEIQKLKGE